MPTQGFSPPGPASADRQYGREYRRPDRHVVGYVIASDPAAAAPLSRAIADYAAHWRLGTVEAVYRDATTDGARPGLDCALNDLRNHKAHGVIVPTPEHISANDTTRATWLASVRAAGGVVHHIDHAEADTSCR